LILKIMFLKIPRRIKEKNIKKNIPVKVTTEFSSIFLYYIKSKILNKNN